MDPTWQPQAVKWFEVGLSGKPTYLSTHLRYIYWLLSLSFEFSLTSCIADKVIFLTSILL